jgi:hypothetical protein
MNEVSIIINGVRYDAVETTSFSLAKVATCTTIAQNFVKQHKVRITLFAY